MAQGSDLDVALFGISGRMGRALLAALDENPVVRLAGALTSSRSAWVGQDVGSAVGAAPRGLLVTADPSVALARARVAIDFTLPQATRANLAACVAARVPIVIGTTGHDQITRAVIDEAARAIPVVLAANMSLGMNLLLKLVELTARTLDASYDIEVVEAHHRNKKDAPSGTALALGKAAAQGRGSDLQSLADYARHGETGSRRPGSIGFSVVRGGDIVGEHVVSFITTGERVELGHRAHDRMGFARGALVAAQWLVSKQPGLYDMQHVLGLK